MKAFLIMNWDNANSEPVSLWFDKMQALEDAARLMSDRHNGTYEVMEFDMQGTPSSTDAWDIREQVIPIIQSAIENNTRGMAETIATAIKRESQRA